MEFLIENVKNVEGYLMNIWIKDDKIFQVNPYKIPKNLQRFKVDNDVYVSAGWIDLHTHCLNKYELYGDVIDNIGVEQGVTTIVDAGTAGADDIEELYKQALNSKTNVYSWINLANVGIQTQDELSDLNHIIFKDIEMAIKKYPEFIKGIKVRMSRSVLGDNGNLPLVIAINFSESLNLPLMVHIGNPPSHINTIMKLLRKGDVVTHIFNPKENGILNEKDQLRFSVVDAKRRGVYFDLGHGTESFGFHTCEIAFVNNMLCDTISTDIYFKNRKYGPVYSLSLCMSKLYMVGYSLNDIINRVTIIPAKILGLESKGMIRGTYDADLTFFKLKKVDMSVQDSKKEERVLKKLIEPVGVMIKGKYYPVKHKNLYGMRDDKK